MPKRSRPGVRGLRGSPELRLRAGLILIAMVLSVFGARLVQLQGLDPKAYAARADAEGLVTVTLPATRGEITDRNGVALARTVTGEMVVADPQLTAPDAEEIATILARRLGLDYFDTLAQLTKENTRFAYLARRVPTAKAEAAVAALRAKKYLGVETRSDPVRSYPAGDVAANLVGFLGGDGAPLAGLEMNFDEWLSGRDGEVTFEAGGGNRIPLGENSQIDPVNGSDLVLTLDRDVQWYAQRVLRNAVTGVGAQSGVAVVLDTRTGEVLALADYPTMDANRPSQARDSDRGSRALSNVYEPGSVEKVLTAAALVDARKVTARTKIRVPSTLPVMDRVIHDYFSHPTLRLTMAGVIAKSSNIGTVLAAQQISHRKLWRYLDAFGLGQRTDIGVPGETRGLLPAAGTWTRLTRATISFGQGVAVNALQMAAAVNTIANGGEYLTPSLIKGTALDDGGDSLGTDHVRRQRVVSERAAREVARMMEMVTTAGAGTAPGAAVVGYRVAGKTGTAQQVGESCRCYDGSLAVSFAGFAPADDPRFTVYVVIQRPRGSASGGGTAGPVFRQILSYVLQKYAVPPTGTRPAHLPVGW